MNTPSPDALDRVIGAFRPAVRALHPYLVGRPPDVHTKLNQNESPYDLPEALKEEIVAAFREAPFNRYPTEQPERLKAALSERLGVPPEMLLVGNGSNELTLLLGITLIERGVPVVLPRPMFSLYAKIVRLFDGALTEVAPLPDLRFDAAGLAAAAERVRPALTVVTTPNNPTGLAMPPEEVEAVVAAAPGVVVVDEAYVDFHPEGSALGLLARYPQLVLMRTFSKAFGLAGLRLGYLVARPEVIAAFTRAISPFVVDPLSEAVAVALLRRADLVEARAQELRRGAGALTAALRGLPGVRVVEPSAANFVIFEAAGAEPGALTAALAARGVLVRDMSGYPDLRGYVRVSVGTPAENQHFLEALKASLVAARPR